MVKGYQYYDNFEDEKNQRSQQLTYEDIQKREEEARSQKEFERNKKLVLKEYEKMLKGIDDLYDRIIEPYLSSPKSEILDKLNNTESYMARESFKRFMLEKNQNCKRLADYRNDLLNLH